MECCIKLNESQKVVEEVIRKHFAKLRLDNIETHFSLNLPVPSSSTGFSQRHNRKMLNSATRSVNVKCEKSERPSVNSGFDRGKKFFYCT